MSVIRRDVLIVAVMAVILLLAATGSLAEKLLQVPLFEVGELWLGALRSVASRICDSAISVPDLYSIWTYVWIILWSVGVYYLLRLLFEPINRVRLLEEVGYLQDGRMSKKDIANMVRKRRLAGDLPPAYPNGWFGVIESRRLKKGEAINTSLLGQNLAVFRDENGEAHVLDAYCPHMGANLAAGGRVIGDGLECPFHGWKFRGHDGKCTHIPYAENIPKMAKVKSWPTTELNGWVYLWYHADDIDPVWTLPVIDEIESGEWTFRGRSEHYISAHIEEIPENGSDVVHLNQVHGPVMTAGIDLRYMWSRVWGFARHEWEAKWEARLPPYGHIGALELKHMLTIFGKRLPPIDLTVSAEQIGPGVVYLRFQSILGKGLYIQSLTPVEPMLQKLVHNIYVAKYMPTLFAKFLMIGEALQVERDIMIWNNKRYEAKPLMVKSKEDALISKHRRWYQQFYSPSSPKIKFQNDTLDW